MLKNIRKFLGMILPICMLATTAPYISSTAEESTESRAKFFLKADGITATVVRNKVFFNLSESEFDNDKSIAILSCEGDKVIFNDNDEQDATFAASSTLNSELVLTLEVRDRDWKGAIYDINGEPETYDDTVTYTIKENDKPVLLNILLEKQKTDDVHVEMKEQVSSVASVKASYPGNEVKEIRIECIDITSDEQEKMNAQFENGNQKLWLSVFDISVLGQDDNKIEETDEYVTITVTLDESTKKTLRNLMVQGLQLKIALIHNGEPELLPDDALTIDLEKGEITFKSKKFSTYGFYVVPEKAGNNTTSTTDLSAEEADTIPQNAVSATNLKTGEAASYLTFWGVLIAAGGWLFILSKRKKKILK